MHVHFLLLLPFLINLRDQHLGTSSTLAEREPSATQPYFVQYFTYFKALTTMTELLAARAS